MCFSLVCWPVEVHRVEGMFYSFGPFWAEAHLEMLLFFLHLLLAQDFCLDMLPCFKSSTCLARVWQYVDSSKQESDATNLYKLSKRLSGDRSDFTAVLYHTGLTSECATVDACLYLDILKATA